MSIEEMTNQAYCWGQNHGGVNLTEIPDFIRQSNNRIIVEAFIHGLYWCQDAGPVVIFTTKNKMVADDLRNLIISIGINTHTHQMGYGKFATYSVCPDTCTDEWELGKIIVGGTKRERFD